MRRVRILFVLSFALAVAALSPVVAFGQVTGTGTIIGSVADQSGAVIVGAEVKLTDRSTGSYQVQPSNQTGRFTFSSIKPGGYDVEVTMKGFRKLMVADQELELGGQLTLNLTLEVGTSTQTVEVTATPGAELQTMNSTMSTSVTGASLVQLPSMDRDVQGYSITHPPRRRTSTALRATLRRAKLPVRPATRTLFIWTAATTRAASKATTPT